jgi:Co/Zn/Cd efflux system component
MVAAGAVWWSTSAWPDLIVAGIMAGLFLSSAVQILRQAWAEYRSAGSGAAVPAE